MRGELSHGVAGGPCGRNIRMFNSGGGAVPLHVVAADQNDVLVASHGNNGKNKKKFTIASQFLSEDDDDDDDIFVTNGGKSLHELCQDPVNTTLGDVMASMALRPKQAETGDENGRKPLFHAIRNGLSLDIIKVLFQAYPNAMVEPDSFSEVLIYMLYLPTYDCSILEWVLEQQPSLTQYRRRSGSLTLVQTMSQPWERCGDRDFWAASVDGWKKMVVTIRAAHAHLTDGKAPSFTMPKLHVMLEYTALAQTTAHLLCRFLDMYEEQVSVPMTKPMLMSDAAPAADADADAANTTEQCSGDMFPLHYLLSTIPFPARRARQNPLVAVLKRFVQAHPQACAVPGPDGRYPLHSALRNGYTWTKGCVSDLVSAHDRALDVADPETGKLPFLVPEDLSDIFLILREGPMAINWQLS